MKYHPKTTALLAVSISSAGGGAYFYNEAAKGRYENIITAGTSFLLAAAAAYAAGFKMVDEDLRLEERVKSGEISRPRTLEEIKEKERSRWREYMSKWTIDMRKWMSDDWEHWKGVEYPHAILGFCDSNPEHWEAARRAATELGRKGEFYELVGKYRSEVGLRRLIRPFAVEALVEDDELKKVILGKN